MRFNRTRPAGTALDSDTTRRGRNYPVCGVVNGTSWFAVCAASVISVPPMILRRVTFANLIYSRCSILYRRGSAPERLDKGRCSTESK